MALIPVAPILAWNGYYSSSYGITASRQDFIGKNGTDKPGELTKIEATAIADAIEGLTTDNLYLRNHYYGFYSAQPIRRLTGSEDTKAIAQNRGANTVGGDTTIPSDIQLTPKQPLTSMRKTDGDVSSFLGTMMLHEYAHVGQPREDLGRSKASEGEPIAYGVEYFFARRSNNSARATTLMNEQRDWFWSDGTWMFCKWFLMLKYCYQIVDGKSSTGAKPWEGAIAAHNVIRYNDPSWIWTDETAKKAKTFAENSLTNDQHWPSRSGFPPGTANPPPFGTNNAKVLQIVEGICVL
jgi:hypothetical protein